MFAFEMGPKCADQYNKYEIFDDSQNASETVYFIQVNSGMRITPESK